MTDSFGQIGLEYPCFFSSIMNLEDNMEIDIKKDIQLTLAAPARARIS